MRARTIQQAAWLFLLNSTDADAWLSRSLQKQQQNSTDADACTRTHGYSAGCTRAGHASACRRVVERVLLVLGSWVGVWRPFHLS